MKTSFIICSYSWDRRNDLIECIESIRQQKYKETETIIVIEQNEALAKYIADYIDNEKEFLIFKPERLGLANARNLGVKSCTGDLISFVDDDATIDQYFTEKALKHDWNTISGLTGTILDSPFSIAIYKFPRSLHWILGIDLIGNSPLGHGTNMTYPKRIFENHQFEDQFTDGSNLKTGLVGDDVLFQLSLDGKIEYDPDLVVFHKITKYKTTNWYISHYSYWQGVAEAKYREIHDEQVKKKLAGRKWFRVKDLIYFNVWLAAICGLGGYLSWKLRIVGS